MFYYSLFVLPHALSFLYGPSAAVFDGSVRTRKQTRIVVNCWRFYLLSCADTRLLCGLNLPGSPYIRHTSFSRHGSSGTTNSWNISSSFCTMGVNTGSWVACCRGGRFPICKPGVIHSNRKIKKRRKEGGVHQAHICVRGGCMRLKKRKRKIIAKEGRRVLAWKRIRRFSDPPVSIRSEINITRERYLI